MASVPKHCSLALGSFVLIVVTFVTLKPWLAAIILAPLYILLIVVSVKNNIISSPRVVEAPPQQNAVIEGVIIYVSGKLTLNESDTKSNSTLRIINRLMTGRSPEGFFMKIPCQLKLMSEPQTFALYCNSDPLWQYQEYDSEDETEYWYAAGKLDPQQEPEFIYQHLGFNSEPAVKIYYIDEQQRPSWLVLSSPDDCYLSNALATLRQSSMIASSS